MIVEPKSRKEQKKCKGRAQTTARSTESRTKRARHRKNSSNTRRTTAVRQKRASTNVERKRQNEGTTYNAKDENDGRVTQTEQKNVED